jgi:hypothetical protein
MFFTDIDYKKIQSWLISNSVKDSSFPNVENLTGNEKVPILQNGKNMLVDITNISASVNGHGTTEERPKTPLIGQSYFDTSLNANIWWDGKHWITYDGEQNKDTVIITEESGEVYIEDGKRAWINTYVNPEDSMDINLGTNSKLVFGPNGKLGKNVIINIADTYGSASIVADSRQQIFEPGVEINGKLNVPFIYPEWWGAKGDGITDDSEAINQCILYSGRSTILMTAERYYVNSTVIVNEETASKQEASDEDYFNDGAYGKQIIIMGSLWGGPNASPVLDLNMSELTFKCYGAIVCNKDVDKAIKCNGERHSDIFINRIMRGRDYTNTGGSTDAMTKYNWFSGTAFYSQGANSARITINTIMGFKYGFKASTEECSAYYLSWMSCVITLGTLICTYPVYVWLAPNTVDGVTNKSRENSFFNDNTITIQGNTVGWNQNLVSKLAKSQDTNSCLVTFNAANATKKNISADINILTVDTLCYKVLDFTNVMQAKVIIEGSYNDILAESTAGTCAKNCINNTTPYSATNKFININGCAKIEINTSHPLMYDWLYINNSTNVSINEVQQSWDISSYYLCNYTKPVYKVVFRPSSILSTVNADTANNAFSSQGIFAYIEYSELSGISTTSVTSTSSITSDGMYVIDNEKSKLWVLVQRISGINHFLGYTNVFAY